MRLLCIYASLSLIAVITKLASPAGDASCCKKSHRWIFHCTVLGISTKTDSLTGTAEVQDDLTHVSP